MDEGEVFPVEKILKKRTRNNKLEYLVKWKNYDESHNSWEPANNFLDSEALKAFNEGSLDSCEKAKKNESRSRSAIKLSGKKDHDKISSEISKARKRRRSSPDEFIDVDEFSKARYCVPKSSPSSNKKRPIVRGSFRTVSQTPDDSAPLKFFTVENESLNSNSVKPDADKKARFCEKTLVDRLQQLSDANLSQNLQDDHNAISIQNPFPDCTVGHDQTLKSFLNELQPLTVDTQLATAPADPEPPDLQIMVSDSELWLINERNANKQKLDDFNSACSNNNEHKANGESSLKNNDAQTAPNAEVSSESAVEDVPASLGVDDLKKVTDDVKLPILNCLDVVITDVKVHDYSVIIKECYGKTNDVVMNRAGEGQRQAQWKKWWINQGDMKSCRSQRSSSKCDREVSCPDRTTGWSVEIEGNILIRRVN